MQDKISYETLLNHIYNSFEDEHGKTNGPDKPTIIIVLDDLKERGLLNSEKIDLLTFPA